MTAAMLIALAAKSAVVGGVTLLLLLALKGRSAAERSWVAHAGLTVLLLLPLGALTLPGWHVAALAPQAPVSVPVASSGATALSAAPGPASASVAAPPALSIDPGTLLEVLYLLGVGVLFLVVIVGVVRLFALRRRAAVLVDAAWLTALARAQRRMGVKSGAALLVSDEIASPLSWGMLRPTILLNEKVVPLHGDAEAIIAHELAHVVRFDWVKLLLARVVTALYWFNPLVWILARQCHQLREEAADDAVLRSDVPCEDYAALLVGAARHDCKAALFAAHGVAPGHSSLRQRVTRVLDESRRRVPAAAAWAACCLVGASLIGGPLSALTLESRPGKAARIGGDAGQGIVAPESRLAPPRSATTAPGAPLTVAAGAASSPVEAISPATDAPSAEKPSAEPLATDLRALDKLTSIHVSGGLVILSYGETASVQPSNGQVIASVDAAGRMTVAPCKGCEGGTLRVTSPTVPPLSAEGGSITVDEGFPAQARGSASIRNGGLINLMAVEVTNGEAEIKGGGQIMLSASSTLNASVKGGGNILYLGNPAVNSMVKDGGWVTKIGG
jgi:beta-lactamase regulating signal transducer with metallopeptidase domain